MDGQLIQIPRMYKKGRAAQKAARLYVGIGPRADDSDTVAV